MLAHTSEERLSVVDALHHPWLTGELLNTSEEDN